MIIQMSTPMKFGKVTKIWFIFNDPLWTYFHWLQQRCTNSGPWRLNLVRWCIIYVDSAWDMLHVASSSRHLEFSGGSYIFGKSVHPCTTVFSHFPFQYVWMSIWGARFVTHPYVYAFWLVYKKKRSWSLQLCVLIPNSKCALHKLWYDCRATRGHLVFKLLRIPSPTHRVQMHPSVSNNSSKIAICYCTAPSIYNMCNSCHNAIWLKYKKSSW